MSFPPISKINRDCFSTIFDVLTRQLPRSETDHRPIVDVRAASQVCRQWRAFLLDSPWIWGRVIDLGYKSVPAKRKEWMEEVVRRARSSGLWVNGNIRKNTLEWPGLFDTEDFFIRLLNGDLATWERIERLSVAIQDANVSEVIQRCFLSRAPALRMFEVLLPEFEFGNRYLFNNMNDSELGGAMAASSLARGARGRKKLFADHAPSLQTIRTHLVIPVHHYSNSPWLPQIRELTVPPRAKLEDVYTLLQRTPMLESLALHPYMSTGEWEWDTTALGSLTKSHKTNIQHLNDIRIDTNLAGCTRILECLAGSLSRTGPAVFRLNIYHSRAGTHVHQGIEQFRKNIYRYIYGYFQFKGSVNEPSSSSTSSIIPAAVFLRIEWKTFTFIDITGSTDHNHLFVNHSADFFIRTYNNDWRQDEEDSFKNSLLDSIVYAAQAKPEGHPPTFRSITKLDLIFTVIPHSLHQNIYSTLSVFNHVQSLKTDEHSLDIIWEIASQHHLVQGNLDTSTQPKAEVLFPELNALYLTFIMDGNYTGLIRLLKQRKELGFPQIAKLDVRETYPSGEGFTVVKHDFSVFEEVDGLEVIWKRMTDGDFELWRHDSEPEYEICRYVCGSGDPEQLRSLQLHP